MMWVVLGMFLASTWLLAAQMLPPLAGPIDTLTVALGDAGSHLATATAHGLGLGHDTPLAHVCGTLAAALSPSVVSLLVAEAAVTSRGARNAAALLLTVTAFCSFLWLPGGEALGLLVATLLLDVLFAIGRPFALNLPVAAVSTALAGRTAIDVVALGGDRFTGPAMRLTVLCGADAGLWRAALAASALTIAAAALLLLLRRS